MNRDFEKMMVEHRGSAMILFTVLSAFLFACGVWFIMFMEELGIGVLCTIVSYACHNCMTNIARGNWLIK